MDEQRWRDPAFRADADRWIDDEVSRLGATRTAELEQPHVTPWSTVLRVPTDRGSWWFKATEESLLHEARVTALVAARRPDVVPPPLAADPDRGWMLLADGGETLRTVVTRERSLDRWRDVLGRYASVQLDLEPAVGDLVAAGAPDRRCAGLPEQYAALVEAVGAEGRFREATDRVAELCAELAAYGIADSVNHDDLHDAQVFVRDDVHLVLDWGDACVSHPFLTMSVSLEGVISWGPDDEEDSEDLGPYRAAYLAPYAARYGCSVADLEPALDLALRLGWACRAVNGHVPGDERATTTRLRMFLDGRPG